MNEGSGNGLLNYSENSAYVPEASSDTKNNNCLEECNELYQAIVDCELKLKRNNEELIRVRGLLERALENCFIDPKTNCFNQNFFEKKFKTECFNPDCDRNKIAVVYVDINGLKGINDTPEDQGGGYKVGDQIIIDTAEFLQSNFREDDIVIHLHGDEFVVICRDRKKGMNEKKLKTKISQIMYSAANRASPLSFAAGVAIFDNKIHGNKMDVNLDDTEIRAEQEMYKIKFEIKNDSSTTY